MGLSAGDLNRRVSLRRPITTYDAFNQPVQGWQTIGPMAASWRRATANERVAAGQVGATVTDIFELRHTARSRVVDPTWELVFQGRAYDIREVTEIGLREGLLVRAAARVDGA